jgi:hypothetical protein
MASRAIKHSISSFKEHLYLSHHGFSNITCLFLSHLSVLMREVRKKKVVMYEEHSNPS